MFLLLNSFRLMAQYPDWVVYCHWLLNRDGIYVSHHPFLCCLTWCLASLLEHAIAFPAFPAALLYTYLHPAGCSIPHHMIHWCVVAWYKTHVAEPNSLRWKQCSLQNDIALKYCRSERYRRLIAHWWDLIEGLIRWTTYLSYRSFVVVVLLCYRPAWSTPRSTAILFIIWSYYWIYVFVVYLLSILWALRCNHCDQAQWKFMYKTV